MEKFSTWLIHKFHGITAKEKQKLIEDWKQSIALNDKAIMLNKEILNSISLAEAQIRIDPLYGYTQENVIEQSKPYIYLELGKAVYPYAHHFVTEDTYICNVNVRK